jgi:hypothetical protein
VRPLTHIGSNNLNGPSRAKYGPNSLDYEFHEENQELYDELYLRGAELINEAEEKFLEKYPEPLSPKELLEELLDSYIRSKEKIIELGAPDSLKNEYDEKIANTSRKLKEGEYLRTGPEYEYKEEFNLKYAEWCKTVLRKLEEEIQEYNEKAYYEWKFSGFDEGGFKKWKNSLIVENDNEVV